MITSRLLPLVANAAGVVLLFFIDALTVEATAVVTIATGLLAILPTLTIVKKIGRLTIQLNTAKEAMSFGSRAWLGNLGSLANARIDQLLMIPILSSRQLGLYVVAVTYFGFIGVLQAALSSALVPRIAQGDRALPARIIRVLCAFAFLTSALLAALAPAFIPILFGPDFQDAVPISWLLLFATIPSQASAVLSSILTAAGRPGAAAMGELFALIPAIPLLLVALPRYGAIDAAGVGVLTYSSRFVYLLYVSARHFNERILEFLLPRRSDVSWFVRGLQRVLRLSPITFLCARRRPALAIRFLELLEGREI